MNVASDGTTTDIVCLDGERGEFGSVEYSTALANASPDLLARMLMFWAVTPSMLTVAEVVLLAEGVSVKGRRPYSEMAVPAGNLRSETI